MNRESLINEFRALVLLQGDGSEVYEILDGDFFAHSRLDSCKGENIIATFDAWKGSRESYCVEEGEKSLFFDGDKAFFHWSQVGENPGDYMGGCDYFGNDYYGDGGDDCCHPGHPSNFGW